MKTCLICVEPITGPEAFRVRIGGVAYEEPNDPEDMITVQFIQETGRDRFPDGTTAKWICTSCALSREIQPGELDYGSCQLQDGRHVCGSSFEEYTSAASDCVLEVERGSLYQNDSDIGPPVVFITIEGGCVHFDCACSDPWRLPLCDIVSSDVPNLP